MKYLGGVHSSCRARRRGGAGWNKPALPCGPTPGPHEWCVCRLALGSARRAPTRPCTRKCDPQPSSNKYQSQTTVGIPTILPFSYMPTEHACKPQHVPKPTATDPFLYQPSYPMEYVTITAGFLHGRGPNRVNQKRKSKSKEQRERERESELCGAGRRMPPMLHVRGVSTDAPKRKAARSARGPCICCRCPV